MQVLKTISRLAGRALRPVRAGKEHLASARYPAVERIPLESSAFQDGGPLPERLTNAEGRNLSPDLRWSAVPAGTQELLLLCEDPDIPMRLPFVHWLLYRIPAHVRELPEGIGRETHPLNAVSGRNSARKIGYLGPHPPPGHGTHHYTFQLFALDTPIRIDGVATRDDVVKAMEGHVLGVGTLVGTYSR
ncbi:MAG TPA: YbhB/YbcL family Raf kinase inhibitor-like protein [Polyangiaceae bacterium]|nr:YbhB/YbcL family Raf kinase inhibitor-like protein [Polyangiaceae bacterium]